jgi:hypothetical protein
MVWVVQPPHPSYGPYGIGDSKTPSVNRVVSNRDRTLTSGWVYSRRMSPRKKEIVSVIFCNGPIRGRMMDTDGSRETPLLDHVRIHWVTRGTGIPKDRDEVNRREVSECDG